MSIQLSKEAYESIRQKCIDWYLNENNVDISIPFPADVVVKEKWFNDYAKLFGGPSPAFSEKEIAAIKIGSYATQKYVMFIDVQSFRLNGEQGIKEQTKKGSWHYSGYLMEITEKGVKYVSPINKIEERCLEKICTD